MSLVDVESASRLLADPTGIDHLVQQDTGAVLGVTQLLVEDLHDGQASIQTNEIGQGQRAHGHVGSELHGGIDILLGGNALLFQSHKENKV